MTQAVPPQDHGHAWQEVRRTLREYCRAALAGLSPLDYYREPLAQTAEIGLFIRDCWDDIIDSVEHTPRHYVSGEAPWEWQRMDEYQRVLLSLVLLSVNAESSALSECRRLVLALRLDGRTAIIRRVAAHFKLTVEELEALVALPQPATPPASSPDPAASASG